MSLYQVRIKSRTIMIRMSFSAEDMTADSGYKGARDCGGLCDHCERVKAACQAAGVENAKGRPALGGVVVLGGLLTSTRYARATFNTRNVTATAKIMRGDSSRTVTGDDSIWTTAGRTTATRAISSTEVLLNAVGIL